MKKRFLSSLAIVVAMSVGSLASGQDYYDLDDTAAAPVSFLGGGGCDAKGCDGKGCDDCGKGGKGCDIDYECCDSGHVYGMVEWTYFAYHRADGSRVGTDNQGESAQADFHSSLRYTAGYIGCSGLGVRARYWSFDHFSNSRDAQNGVVAPAEGVYTNTSNFDIELFETIELNCDWALEISGGIRYNDFEEVLLDIDAGVPEVRINASDSLGLIVGLEAKRMLSIGSLYLGARTSILMGAEKLQANTNSIALLQDVPQQQFEIFGGWEYDRCLDSGSVFFLRAGLEYQHWMNFSGNFVLQQPGNGEQAWIGSSDVGFGGITVGAGLLY